MLGPLHVYIPDLIWSIALCTYTVTYYTGRDAILHTTQSSDSIIIYRPPVRGTLINESLWHCFTHLYGSEVPRSDRKYDRIGAVVSGVCLRQTGGRRVSERRFCSVLDTYACINA